MTGRGEGFSGLATWVALDPDNESFIFRKFDKLAARRLLHMQAKLASLEGNLKRHDKNVLASLDMDVRSAAREFEELVKQKDAGNETAIKTMELLEEVDETLPRYQEALVLQSQVAGLHRPSKRTLEAYRYVFSKPFPALFGSLESFLDDEHDLVVLMSPNEVDYLSRFLRRVWFTKTDEGPHRIGRFSEKSIVRTANIINVVVAACLLIGPIAGFFFVTSPKAKLGGITGFTALFALCVWATTNARRAELFGASAAYAAVLVVFVSTGELAANPVSDACNCLGMNVTGLD